MLICSTSTCEILDRYDALVASVVRSVDEWQRSRGFPLAKTHSNAKASTVKPEIRAYVTNAQKIVTPNCLPGFFMISALQRAVGAPP